MCSVDTPPSPPLATSRERDIYITAGLYIYIYGGACLPTILKGFGHGPLICIKMAAILIFSGPCERVISRAAGPNDFVCRHLPP